MTETDEPPGERSELDRYRPPRWQGPEISRREALVALAISAGAAALPWPRLAIAQALSRALDPGGGMPTDGATTSAAVPTLTLRLVRREDLLNIRVDTYNLVASGATLVRKTANAAAWIVFELPGQHLQEQAVLFGDPVPNPGPGIQGLLANPTRLAFRVPVTVTSIPLTAAGLLNWLPLPPSLVAAANGANPTPPTIAAPTPVETAIEVPWALVLSPTSAGLWSHRTAPLDHTVSSQQWTEIWHTVLGQSDGAGGVAVPPAVAPQVRAVWTPGWPGTGSDPFTPVALDAAQRQALVRNTSSYVSELGAPRVAIPARADQLMLTALGATVNIAGYWPDGTLIAWRHRSQIGRDAYVRVVEKGYLYPFGHPAALVTITERIFAADVGGDLVAYLRQRQFVVVRQPVLDLTSGPFASVPPDVARQSPFRRVELTTLTTPDLDLTANAQTNVGPGLQHPDCFWLVAGGTDVAFGARATDWSGRAVDFDLPQIFIRAGSAAVDPYDPGPGSSPLGMGAVRAAYIDPANTARRSRPFVGQTVAFAPAGDPGDTDVIAETIAFDTAPWPGSPSGDAPAFFGIVSPEVDHGADVHIPALNRLLGEDLLLKTNYADVYIVNGFGVGNPGEIFLEIPPAYVQPIKTPPKKVGGLGTPVQDAEVHGRKGPKGDRANAKAGTMDPSTLFGDDAKLLGGLRLKDTIVSLNNPAEAQERGLNIRQVTLVDPDTLVPIAVQMLLTFHPNIQADPLGLLEVTQTGQVSTSTDLVIGASLIDPLDGSPTVATSEGKLTNFKLHLFGKGSPSEFLVLDIDEASFHLDPESKLTFNVEITGVTPMGPLTFVQELAKLLPGNDVGFSIKLTDEGVEAGTSLPIPTINIGYIAISHLKFGMAVTLPFDGSPLRVRWSFSTKDDPFTLTICLFGGGGWLELCLGADGVESLTIGFVFGAMAELNVGVASGVVYIQFGIVLVLKVVESPQKGQETDLTGFVRAGGGLEFFGMLTITMELYIALTYKDPGKAYGKAKFTVSLAISILSVTFTFEAERELAGTGADPGFADQISPADWSAYCGAFSA